LIAFFEHGRKGKDPVQSPCTVFVTRIEGGQPLLRTNVRQATETQKAMVRREDSVELDAGERRHNSDKYQRNCRELEILSRIV
jgi:hypothetical protein